MQGKMEVFGATDIGRKRQTNEDQFMISDLCKSMRVHQTSLALDHRTRLFGETQGRLLLVADGMGGHEAGERASQLALDGIVDYVLNTLGWYLLQDDLEDVDFEQQLKAGLLKCQKLIQREVENIPQRRGMGSTLTLAYIAWPRMFVVHVGDSRCYLLRDGTIRQLTRDHTMAQAMFPNRPDADESQPDPEGPLTNMLWNVLGGKNEPHPDAASYELQIGDALVLCTDGLTKHLSRKRIHEIIASDQPLADACGQAIAEANDAGGTDNITLVACRFRENNLVEEEEEAVELPLAKSTSSLEDTEDDLANV